MEYPTVFYRQVRRKVTRGVYERPPCDVEEEGYSHHTFQGHVEALRGFRGLLLAGGQLFPPVRQLPLPQPTCSCGVGLRFAQRACLEALWHEREATRAGREEPVSLHAVCSALGQSYPYCCRSCAFGPEELLEVWSWLRKRPAEKPLPLDWEPASDFVGQTLRNLPLVPLDPVSRAWCAEEGVGSRSQRDLHSGMKRLLGASLRQHACFETQLVPGYGAVSLELVVRSFGRLHVAEDGTTVVVPRCSVALHFYRQAASADATMPADEVVRLPGTWPASPVNYCAKGEVPRVRGRDCNLRLTVEQRPNVVVTEVAREKKGEAAAAATLRHCVASVRSVARDGRSRRLSVELRPGKVGQPPSLWVSTPPTSRPPPKAASQSLLKGGRRPPPKTRRHDFAELRPWLRWLADASARDPKETELELAELVRDKLLLFRPARDLAARLLAQEAEQQPYAPPPTARAAADVLPHASRHELRLAVLAEMVARVVAVHVGLEEPAPQQATKVHCQRSELWRNEVRRHLLRAGRRSLEALGKSVPEVVVRPCPIAAAASASDVFALFETRAVAEDFVDCASLRLAGAPVVVDGLPRTVVRRGAGGVPLACPACASPRAHGAPCPVCRLAGVGAGFQVCLVALGRRTTVPPTCRQYALCAAARLFRAPRSLDGVLLGARPKERRGGPKYALGGRELPQHVDTARGFAVRRATAPVPLPHEVHLDNLIVSDAGGHKIVYLRNCGGVQQSCARWEGQLRAALLQQPVALVAPDGSPSSQATADLFLGEEHLWSFPAALLHPAMLFARAAVRRVAKEVDDFDVHDAAVQHCVVGGRRLAVKVCLAGGELLLTVRAAPVPPEPCSWSELFERGVLVKVMQSEYHALLPPADFDRGFHPQDEDGLAFALLSEELLCHVRSLQTPRGPGHPVRIDYVKKGVDHALAPCPLDLGGRHAGAAFGFAALGNAVHRPNPRGLPSLTRGGLAMTWLVGWKRDYVQLQEDSFGVNPEAFRGELRGRVHHVATAYCRGTQVVPLLQDLAASVRAAFVAERCREPEDAAELIGGLDGCGLPVPGRFFVAGSCLYHCASPAQTIWCPCDAWLLHSGLELGGSGGASRRVFQLLRYTRAGNGDKFLAAFEKMSAVLLERPLGLSVGVVQGFLATPSISSRNAEAVTKSGFVAHLALAAGASSLRRPGGHPTHLARIQELLCGGACALDELEQLRRTVPGASRRCESQAVDLRSGAHEDYSVVVLPLTLYAAKQNGVDGYKFGAGQKFKADPAYFDYMTSQGFAPAVRAGATACRLCGAVSDCACRGAGRQQVALSQSTVSVAKALRCMGLGLHVGVSERSDPNYALVTPQGPAPCSQQELLRETEVAPGAGGELLRLAAGPSGLTLYGRATAAQVVMDLHVEWLVEQGHVATVCTDRSQGHAALGRATLREARRDLLALAGAVEAFRKRLAALLLTCAEDGGGVPTTGRSAAGLRARCEPGGVLSLRLAAAEKLPALACLRWGAGVLAVTRAVLVEAPRPEALELRVVNRSYASYDCCAEAVLAGWLHRNLERPLLAPVLEKLPLTERALVWAGVVGAGGKEVSVDVELRFPEDAPMLDATDFYLLDGGAEGGVRLFGMAMPLAPNPRSAGWTRAARLGGFRFVLLAARPCAETATLWHMVELLRARGLPLAPAVAGCPAALTAVSPPGPVYKVREERGAPANLACCRYGVFAGGAEVVRQRVEELCDNCGDCDIEELASGGRGPPLLRMQLKEEVRLRCCTNEGLDDGAERPEPTGLEWPEELGTHALPPAVLRLLAHDTPRLQEQRAFRALAKLAEAADELIAVLRACGDGGAGGD
jgi:hypothetical protein